MQEPPLPFDETMRLMSLHSLRILDTHAEERFDRITRMAQRMFDVEICLVSLVDGDRQWFKSKQGLDACETAREISFCGHAILDDKLFIITDARGDPRFADNPLVTGEPFIRFYAGCPVRGPDGQRIGTLCLIDSAPRELSRDDQETLRDLGSLVEDELALVTQSTVDELTQIANRRGFYLVAERMLAMCRRTSTDAELLFFDLDGFKRVNDELGHASGDVLLKQFAKFLMKCFREADVIARLGGDEFVVLLVGSDISAEPALARLDALARAATGDVGSSLRWSVGRIEFDAERHAAIEMLLADADARMYLEKKRRAGG